MGSSDPGPDAILRDETALHWGFLEEEPDACAVVSRRMELVYANAPARALVPGEWFGKRCFEVLPVVDETCALHCPTIQAVNESSDVVFCEETLCLCEDGAERVVRLGVGLIPLGARTAERGRAVLLLRAWPPEGESGGEDEASFRARLLADAEGLRQRIAARTA